LTFIEDGIEFSMNTASFPSWPHFAADEIAAVQAVLQSGCVNYWTGTECRDFEGECAGEVGTSHAIALANGTAALELALRAYEIGPGDEVVTSPRTFIASASCVVMCGARPIFADVDSESQNITAESVARVLTPRTRAIIAVHLAGWPCDMDAIMSLAAEKRLIVIEDCAQSIGARYRGRPVGGIGHAGTFSFCQDKIITTGGEGGMLTTNDESAWSRAWSFKDHGKSFEAVFRKKHPSGFKWLHESFGTNWRMTEMQAAIGRVQIAKLPRWIEMRRHHARMLVDGLREAPGLRIPEPPAHTYHAYYKFYAFVDLARLKNGWDRNRIMFEITNRGVPCFSGSCSEIYLERAFEAAQLQPSQRMPVAMALGESSLMLLVHPTLDDSHIGRACEVVNEVMRVATRRPSGAPRVPFRLCPAFGASTQDTHGFARPGRCATGSTRSIAPQGQRSPGKTRCR
jgi:dTDP-4-amino-4,6-dideoxygalactose transaminase